MRIRTTCLLASLLIGASSAAAQPQPAKDPPAVGNYRSAVDDGVGPASPGVLENTGVGGGEMPLPGNCVPQMFWFRADYLVWWLRKEQTPPIIQSLPDSLALTSDLPPGSATTLFPGNNQLRYNGLSGLRLDAGLWLTADHQFGIDVGGFAIQNRTLSAAYASDANGSPILARFYTNANTGALTSLKFSIPDPATGYSGALSASAAVSNIYSGDANIVWNGFRVFSDNTDWLLGARYFGMRERLDVNGTANFRDGSGLSVRDHFAVSNQFYGAQIGWRARLCGWYGFSVDGIFKFALGSNREQVNISGSNTFTSPTGVTNTQAGGLYAQDSNSGTHTKDKIAVLPDLTANLNYNITQRCAAYVGWNFLYVNHLVRVGSTIDSNVNDSNIRYVAAPTPGNAAGPVFTFKQESVWLQGINIGLRYEY